MSNCAEISNEATYQLFKAEDALRNGKNYLWENVGVLTPAGMYAISRVGDQVFLTDEDPLAGVEGIEWF